MALLLLLAAYLVLALTAGIACYALWINKLARAVCACTARMDGKTVIVTGANCGIGKETARDLAARGARVILACRDLEKADKARDDIVAATGTRNIVIRHLDLESLKSVRKFVGEIRQTEKRLDVLVNNAGAGGLPLEFTEDNLTRGMQTNHFGPFLLTCLLLDLLKRTPSSRIIVLASSAHICAASFDVENINCEKSPIDGFHMYCYSKLCNILMTRYLAQRLEGTGVTVNCLHPGFVRTEIFRRVPVQWIRRSLEFVGNLFLKTARDGAQTVIHLAVSTEGGRVTGRYFVDLKESAPSKVADDPGLAEKVWRKSETYVRLSADERPF